MYNDLDGAKRLHSYLSEQNIHSIWGDGRFPDFDVMGDSDLSTDGTREFIESQDDTTLLSLGGMYEYDKLTAMLHHAGDMGYEYAVCLGCDEIPRGRFEDLEGNLESLPDAPNVYRLAFESNDNTTHNRDFVERLFHYPKRITVRVTHWSYHIDDSEEPYISDEKIIPGITVFHDNSIRPKNRDNLMSKYQAKQIKNERGDHFAKRLGVSPTPDMESLQKLFPDNTIMEKIRQGRKYYTILGQYDTRKLLFTWKRVSTDDGIMVYS